MTVVCTCYLLVQTGELHSNYSHFDLSLLAGESLSHDLSKAMSGLFGLLLAVHNLYVFVGAAVLLVQVHEVISDILGAILFICCSVVCQVSLKPTNNANPLDV